MESESEKPERFISFRRLWSSEWKVDGQGRK